MRERARHLQQRLQDAELSFECFVDNTVAAHDAELGSIEYLLTHVADQALDAVHDVKSHLPQWLLDGLEGPAGDLLTGEVLGDVGGAVAQAMWVAADSAAAVSAARDGQDAVVDALDQQAAEGSQLSADGLDIAWQLAALISRIDAGEKVDLSDIEALEQSVDDLCTKADALTDGLPPGVFEVEHPGEYVATQAEDGTGLELTYSYKTQDTDDTDTKGPPPAAQDEGDEDATGYTSEDSSGGTGAEATYSYEVEQQDEVEMPQEQAPGDATYQYLVTLGFGDEDAAAISLETFSGPDALYLDDATWVSVEDESAQEAVGSRARLDVPDGSGEGEGVGLSLVPAATPAWWDEIEGIEGIQEDEWSRLSNDEKLAALEEVADAYCRSHGIDDLDTIRIGDGDSYRDGVITIDESHLDDHPGAALIVLGHELEHHRQEETGDVQGLSMTGPDGEEYWQDGYIDGVRHTGLSIGESLSGEGVGADIGESYLSQPDESKAFGAEDNWEALVGSIYGDDGLEEALEDLGEVPESAGDGARHRWGDYEEADLDLLAAGLAAGELVDLALDDTGAAELEGAYEALDGFDAGAWAGPVDEAEEWLPGGDVASVSVYEAGGDLYGGTVEDVGWSDWDNWDNWDNWGNWDNWENWDNWDNFSNWDNWDDMLPDLRTSWNGRIS